MVWDPNRQIEWSDLFQTFHQKDITTYLYFGAKYLGCLEQKLGFWPKKSPLKVFGRFWDPSGYPIRLDPTYINTSMQHS